MCRVIAVSNQKGGVGKTVSCVNLGIGLAQEGKKVLMIDADPQGSLTISLGYEEPDEMEYSLATLMMNIVNDEKLNIEKTILHHKEGVDLIPANIELSAIEVSLVNAMSRELILRSMVDRLREFYDYIIIDCMPSLGMMTINALACADSVLIPVQAAYLPVKGLQQLEDIQLEGFRVAENTAVKEEKKVITLTVAECMEFHSMGEFHENIKSVAEAVAKFKAIPPERMHGVPAIGIRAADPKDPDEYTEMDVLIGRRIDMDMLRYIPEIADNWQAQQMIASLIHEMPDVKVVGQIPDSIQKKIDWLESRDKRTDELQQITDKLEKGVVEVFQSDRYKQFLDTMAKFPRYSVNNSLLIMMQKPDAQLCQSFTGWKQMGRYVKKGEKGISILAPAPYKIEREQTKLDEKGRPVFDADGEPVKEKVEVTIRAFKVVKTFDLSQTDGKELPTIGPSELVGNIEGYPKLLQALQEISPVPVSFELIDGDAKGFYHLEDKKIVVQDGMSEVQTIKTLLHEMAHQKLHDKDNVPEAKDISRNGKEVEAESVAYVVCQHYGINTSDYSFSYVAGWSEGKETPELKASLDKIRQTASEFIYQIDQKMQVLMADKDQVQESAKTSSPFAQELMDKITEGAKDLGFIPVVPETQEKTVNPELKVVVDKALKDLDKKRTLSKVKESVKSKLKANTEKAEQEPKKNRTSKAKEERA